MQVQTTAIPLECHRFECRGHTAAIFSRPTAAIFKLVALQRDGCDADKTEFTLLSLYNIYNGYVNFKYMAKRSWNYLITMIYNSECWAGC